eukprot:2704160-Prymnesium_polylepis.1
MVRRTNVDGTVPVTLSSGANGPVNANRGAFDPNASQEASAVTLPLNAVFTGLRHPLGGDAHQSFGGGGASHRAAQPCAPWTSDRLGCRGGLESGDEL